MKKKTVQSFKLSAVTAVVAVLLFSSCKKEDTSSNTITEEEAAEVMIQSMSDDSGGFTAETESAARVANTTSISCGQVADTAFTGQSLPAAAITYQYSIQMSRLLTCNAGIPQQFTFTYNGQNTYTAPRMSSNDNTTASFTITGLQPSATQYVFNQNYVRNGTQQSLVRLHRSFTSTLTITSSNITVDKSTEKIVSGTASIQFTGSVVGGGSISYGAIFTFLGNNHGTLTFNNGSSFDVEW